jgi:hypothetical protein
MGSIIYVHGTGVRQPGYGKDCELIRKKLAPGWTLVECPWGDAHGVKLHLQGQSVPDYPAQPAEQDELMRWWRLYQDPLCELRELAALDADQVWLAPGQEAAWQTLAKTIASFAPSEALRERIAECGLDSFWKEAAGRVRRSDEYEEAIERAGPYPGHFRRAFARAVFATASAAAAETGRAVASGSVRDEIVDLVVRELGGDDLGVRDLGKAALGAIKSVGNIFGAGVGATAMYTGVFSRARITDKSLPAAGDILLYQTRGQKIRDFIKSKIKGAAPPIYLLAHSLGGIACVDLLALDPLPVAGLITAGSQAPLLYEMNALVSLEEGAPLPAFFPQRWLNFYDPNDLLSYAGEKVFPNRVKDVPIHSRQPFPQAHSAYWREPKLWEAISSFLNSPR